MASAHGLRLFDKAQKVCVGELSHHLFGVGCSDMSTH